MFLPWELPPSVIRRFIPRGHSSVITPPVVEAITNIAPGLGWTGTATTAGAPADQSTTIRTVSTYAKPAVDILTDAGGMVVDSNDLVIGIHAYAGNSNGPLPVSVEVWIEGATFSVPRASHSYVDANGNFRTIWGYFARLKHSSFTQDGACNVKWNVTVPSDPTYQNRTLGPFKYTRVSSFTGNDYSKTVGAAGDYATLPAAFAALQGLSAANPKITLLDNGLYELGQPTTGYVGSGYCTIEAAPGVSARLVRTVDWIKYHGLRLRGSGIKIDLEDFPGSAFVFDNTQSRWKQTILDGCEVYNGAGRDSKEAMRQGSRTTMQTNGNHAGFIILDDTYFHDLVEGLSGTIAAPWKPAWLMRNVRIDNIGGADVVQHGVTNIYGLKVRGQSLSWFTEEAGNEAGLIQYSTAVGGAATTATWETSTLPGSPANVLTLKKDGATVAAIPLNTTGLATSGFRSIADIKAAIEANTGWTFTLQNDKMDAQWLVDSKAHAIANLPAPATNCLNVTSQIYTLAGFHGDLTQPYVSGAGPFENLLYVNIDAINKDLQAWFLTGSTNGWNDMFIINYAVGGTARLLTASSQTSGGACRNIHFWHCSFPDQRFGMLNGSPSDAYCSVKGSIFRDWYSVSSFLTGSLMGFDSNFIETRTSNPPNETNKKNLGSTCAALLNDIDTDLLPDPLSGLATISSLVEFDATGAERGATSYIGAFA